jgi:hypothetical protein
MHEIELRIFTASINGKEKILPLKIFVEKTHKTIGI